MKNAPRQNLGAPLQRGQRITVVASHPAAPLDTVVVIAQVQSAGRKIRWKSRKSVAGWPDWRTNGSVMRRDEGTTWVRGWDTEEALAMQAAAALAASMQAAAALAA